MDNIPEDIIREGTLMAAWELVKQSSYELNQLLHQPFRIDSEGFIDLTDDNEPTDPEEKYTTAEELESLADLRWADDEDAYQQDGE